MLNKNFYHYGRDIKLIHNPSEMVITNEYTLTLNQSTFSNYDDFLEYEYVLLDSLYIGKNVLIIDVFNETHEFILTRFNKIDKTITLRSEIPKIIKPKTLYLNEKIIQSGSYEKKVSIKDVTEIGQQYNNNTLTFKLNVLLDKPKFYNVYKYTIKYNFNSEDCYEYIIEDFVTKSHNNHLLTLNFVKENLDVFNYKISAHYKYKKEEELSFYSNIRKIIKNDI